MHGLAQRRAAQHAPLTLLSCDNLPANGDSLQGLVLAFAEQVDAGLRDWIATKCTFPNSVVDRIVPRASGTDRARIASATGLLDAAPVVAEPYADWVVEDRFANGRPAWELAGARFVDDAAPHERAKLRIVNGSHSALAYLGAMAGWRSVDQAIAVPALRRYLDALLREEVVPTLGAVPGLDLVAYRARMFERFANPALQHATAQIAMDGSQKLPQRLLGTVRDRLDAHRPIERLALAVAAWLHYLSGTDETGATHAIDDPLANALAEQLARAEATGSVHDGVACMLSFAPVFGALAAEPRFVSAVTRHVISLRQRGVLATLERLAV